MDFAPSPGNYTCERVDQWQPGLLDIYNVCVSESPEQSGS